MPPEPFRVPVPLLTIFAVQETKAGLVLANGVRPVPWGSARGADGCSELRERESIWGDGTRDVSLLPLPSSSLGEPRSAWR